MRCPTSGSLLAGVLSLFVSAAASAQTFSIFPIDKIRYVDVYTHRATIVGGSPLEERGGGVRGVGFELLLYLGRSGVGPLKDLDLDVAIGYEYQSGFRSTVPTLELYGGVQAIPALTLYLSRPKVWRHLTPYVGVSSGLVLLSNIRAYDPIGRQFAADGLTYQFGVGAGVVHDSGILLEVTYNHREFGSVDWKFGSGGTTVPDGWPRTLNASTLAVSLGVQFENLNWKKP